VSQGALLNRQCCQQHERLVGDLGAPSTTHPVYAPHSEAKQSLLDVNYAV